MDIALISGRRGKALAESIARELAQGLLPVQDETFPDGEIRIRIESPVAGKDVFLIQSTTAPVGETLLELLLLTDAVRRAGAGRVTAVVPYFGYARQDRRKREGEPVGLRVVAETLRQAAFDRLVTIDLHSPSTEGCFPCPVLHLTALPLLVEAARPHLGADGVVVSPDLGAARLARECGKRLGLPVALVHKTRLSGREVAAEEVAGEVHGRVPFIIDDMISTGGTIAAALGALARHGARRDAIVAATHGVFTSGSGELLRTAGVARLFVTDSVEAVESQGTMLQQVSLAPLLALAIRRIHEGRSLGDLISSR